MKQKAISLIYKLQEYLKMDLIYLIKGEFWLMSGRIISLATSFVLALAWANWIDQAVYGKYQFILSFVGIASIFTLPALSTAVTRSVARGLEGAYLNACKIKIKFGLVSTVLFLGASLYYLLQDNFTLGFSFVFIAFIIPFFEAPQIYRAFLTGKKMFQTDFKYSAIVRIASASAMLAGLFLITNLHRYMASSSELLIILAACYLPGLFLYWFFFKKIKKYRDNKRRNKKTLSYGKHLTIIDATGIIAGNIDKIIMFHYFGAVDLAVYSFAILIPEQIKVFYKHIGELTLPKLSIRTKQELKKTILKKIVLLSGLIAIAALIYFLIAPYVYMIFFPKYERSILFSKIYVFSLIPLAYSLLGGVFRSQMLKKQLYLISIIAPIARIILMLVLIPQFGILGAVLGVLGARLFDAFLHIFFFKTI